MTAPTGLAKKSIGTSSLFWFLVGASAPMTVLVGGVIATYQLTGVVGTPLSFLMLSVALGLFAVGYVAMARHVPHAATFYAFFARGLGRVWGVSGSFIALLSYNALQIALYGLIGSSLADLIGGPWWAWALAIWAIIALLGLLHVTLNAVVLAVILITEIAVIVLFDVAAFISPADGVVSAEPMMPSELLVTGVGGVFALAVASFIGFELGPVFGEEARSHNSVSRATFWSLGFIGLFYAITAWATALAVGPSNVAAAAAEQGPGIVFGVMEANYGKALSYLAQLLLITSIFGSMLSFHNGVGRYVFGLSREGVLPQAFSRVGSSANRAGAPVGGSVLQSLIALAVLGVCIVLQAEPMAFLFTWLATTAAVGVMALILGTNLAVIGFFRRGGGTRESYWQRVIAPVLGAIAIAGILVITVANLSSLLGLDATSPLQYVVPGLILVAAVLGALWGISLRARPDVYSRIGIGEPETLAVLETDLADLRV
jgi:amino acid transporter